MRFEQTEQHRKRLLSALFLLLTILLVSLLSAGWTDEARAQGTVPTEGPSRTPTDPASTATDDEPDAPPPADTATSTPVLIFPSPTATATATLTPSPLPTSTLAASATGAGEAGQPTQTSENETDAQELETSTPVPPFITLVPAQPRVLPPSWIVIIAAILIAGVLIWVINRYMR